MNLPNKITASRIFVSIVIIAILCIIPFTAVAIGTAYSFIVARIVGNEENGMSKGVKDACDYIARIPMKGKINSLNASVAAGIMIYEMIRLD